MEIANKLRFQPPNVNLAAIKVIKKNDTNAMLTNLLSYIWIRTHYCYDQSFERFNMASEFELWHNHILERMPREFVVPSIFYKIK